LYQLQLDGRLANNELAARVGLSPSPCLRRVRQLEADGTIEGYTARVDRAALGRSFEVLMWVTLDHVSRTTMAEIEAAMLELPPIVEAMRMMGQPDYLLRVAVRDAAEFESVYIDQLATLPHVQTLTSMTSMKVVKRDTPVRPPAATPQTRRRRTST
jgi:DNA-binding Lrp family transcriptional regulator